MIEVNYSDLLFKDKAWGKKGLSLRVASVILDSTIHQLRRTAVPYGVYKAATMSTEWKAYDLFLLPSCSEWVARAARKPMILPMISSY